MFMVGIKKKVLFICVYNSDRSQMAEGLLRATYPDSYEAYSAGIKLAAVDLLAVEVMNEIGIDISKHKSKTRDFFRGLKFDCVATLCSSMENNCPFFPGAKKYIHKGFGNPHDLDGDDLTNFRKVRDEIRQWIIETF